MCYKALYWAVRTYWQIVHTVLGYGTAFSSSPFQEFLISFGLSQTPHVWSWNYANHFNMYETDSYVWEGKYSSVNQSSLTRCSSKNLAFIYNCCGTLSEGCLLALLPFQADGIVKISLIFFQDSSSLILIQLWSCLGSFFCFPAKSSKVI